jgi:hypothetical protein
MTIAINGTQYNMILDTVEINSTQPPIIIPANSKLDVQPGVYNVFVYQRDIKNFGYLYTAFIFVKQVLLGTPSYPFNTVTIDLPNKYSGVITIEYMDFNGNWHSNSITVDNQDHIHIQLDTLTNTAYIVINEKYYQIVNGHVSIKFLNS